MKPCDRDPGLGYLAWHGDAAKRHASGQRQLFCGDCRKWQWPEYCCRPVALTRRVESVAGTPMPPLDGVVRTDRTRHPARRPDITKGAK